MSLEIQISSSLLLTSANKRQTFFTSVLFRVLFGVIFFPKSCLKVLAAAYTRVRLIHESLRYMYSLWIIDVAQMSTHSLVLEVDTT